MGLKADFDEVRHVWDHSPWRVKVGLAVALFISTSALASLSEAVFKWKGFVLDALAFYRSWISHPLGEYAQRIVGQPLPFGFIDMAVFYALFLGALTRALIYRNKSWPKQVLDIIFMTTIYCVMLWLAANSSGDAANASKSDQFTIWVMYPIYVFAAYFLTKGAERVLAVAYMVIPALLLGFLAAVTIGLSK